MSDVSGAATDEPTARRGPSAALAVVLLAVAALCLWSSSRMTWVDVTSADGLGEERATAVEGGTWVAALTPLALALLAAVAASFAVRGWALKVVALLVALVAVAAAIPSIDLVVSGTTDERAGSLAELPARAEVTGTVVHIGPAVLAIVGAVAALAAAVALALRPRAKSGLSSKYAAPAARKDAATEQVRAGGDEPVTQRMLWDALDAGEDPTTDASTASASPEARAAEADEQDDNPGSGGSAGESGTRS
ncbi:TIGR02234 family membrane protein [Rhodococcus sp. HNM0569]|uniref:TIGR02234 family membrane protein n=1 Tax=Rhodococcus sp. HNM0569 TaxID=2716340 RepID=UPI00146BFFC6|nr:TIGR02234 family membrane protein [Rhodococcus sp. HNM0569]NLU82983.1 TIGR02234 family membrane protein [Rhodococcus sp. HNM0569]